MAVYNRQAALADAVAKGLTPEQANAQIDAYLASPQAHQDSLTIAAPPTQVTPGGVVSGVADAAGQAVQGLGGLKTLGVLGGGAALLKAGQAIASRVQGPPAGPAGGQPVAAPAAATAVPTPAPEAIPAAPVEALPPLPKDHVRLTEADIQRFPKKLGNFNPGDPIAVKDLNAIRLGGEPHTGRVPGSAAARSAAAPAPEPARPSPRGKVVGAIKPVSSETKPITVYGREGGPTQAAMAAGSESASRPELMRRAAGFSPGSKARAIALKSLGMTEDELAAGLKQAGSAIGRTKAIAATLAKTPVGKAAGKGLQLLGEADKALGAAGFILPKEVFDQIQHELETQMQGKHAGPQGT
jgi:hypothetical protein